MGNLFLLGLLINPCIKQSICKRRKLLQIVRADGKVIKFTSPVLVKDLLINFVGFGVGSSKKASKIFPPNFKLKLGKVYHLLPPKALDQAKKPVLTKIGAKPKSGAVTRIKIVITKQQLEELLSKKTSIEDIILGSDSSSTNWKPSLTSIPEENELNSSYVV